MLSTVLRRVYGVLLPLFWRGGVEGIVRMLVRRVFMVVLGGINWVIRGMQAGLKMKRRRRRCGV